MSRVIIEPNEESPRSQLKTLAREIVSGLSQLEPGESEELLGSFVSELFLAVAEQSRREERRQKQAEGIAAAKARGVRFGRPSPVLPDSFDALHHAWRRGEMSLRQAADACGITKSSFYNAAVRREQAAEHAV